MAEKSVPKEFQPRLVDLEFMNTLTEGCPACKKPFTLGDQVVPACGSWDGMRFIHLKEARFDEQRNMYMDRNY